MNQNDILRGVASRLYVEAADKCFLSTVIAVAAIVKLKNKEVPPRETLYISPHMLMSFVNVPSKQAA